METCSKNRWKAGFLDSKSKAVVVRLIANGNAEKALEALAKHYGVDVPKLRVGLPKGRKRNSVGTYDRRSKTIAVLDSDTLKQPFVILHEFYHHLRTNIAQEHKGTEKGADAFAKDYIQAYNAAMTQAVGK